MEVKKPAVILACDIDRTLVAGMYDPSEREEADQSLNELHGAIAHIKNQADFPLLFGTVTGNTPASQAELEAANESFSTTMELADYKINSVGARIAIKNSIGEFEAVTSWPIAPHWNRDIIASTLATRPELDYQDDIAQDDYKVSFDVYDVSEEYHEQYVAAIQRHLGNKGILAHVIFSGGRYLDILPEQTNKGTSLRYTVPLLMEQHHLSQVVTIGAGDSLNDTSLLAATDLAALPGNADPSLQAWVSNPENIHPQRVYQARSRFAAGVLESLRHFAIY